MAALNVIPAEVRVGGTARAFTPEVRTALETEIGRLAHGIAAALGVEAQYEFIRRIPPVVNAPGRSRRGACRSAGYRGECRYELPALYGR